MRVLVCVATLCLSSLSLLANVQERLKEATDVFNEIMSTPDKGIPQNLLDEAHCAIIVPGLKKGAFIVGGQYGKGFVTCRKASGTGWSAPAAIRVEGGSVGFQIGGSETDVVMLVMNQHGMDDVMKSKFTIGADAEAAAGPVGRTASAETSARIKAEILSWSRSRGLFAGISLKGATLRPDHEANQESYGKRLETRDIVMGNMEPPAAAVPLLAALQKASPRLQESNADRSK
jgi:lipid-binding SYLF domain-containing protein